MTGPKLNEGALLIDDDRPITKATAKYLRGSASKARVVLDLVRGLDVRRADEILQFTTRDVAQDIRKVLASAVANAVHNNEQDADELFVLACFADEGPTLRRFRPRARGRATRINKRTCHITVVVARLSDERLEVIQSRQQTQSATGRRRAGTTAQSRRDRVERSRTRAQGLRGEPTPQAADEHLPEETPGADVDAVEVAADRSIDAADGEVSDTAVVDIAQSDLADEPDVSSEAGPDAEDDRALEHGETEPSSEEIAASAVPDGAIGAPEDGSIPAGYEIKGNANSMKYHVPGGRYYDVTIAEVFFDTAEHAEAAGYEAPIVDTEETS